MNKNRLDATAGDLSSLFDLEIEPTKEADLDPSKVLCAKCHGRGNFVGYSGRIIGKCFACNGTGLLASVAGRPNTSTEINVTKIAEAFDRAKKAGLKRPKVTFKSIQFSRAPDAGKNPGAIYVKRGEDYLGKIIAGRFHGSSSLDAATRAEITIIASDPSAAAKAHGLQVGWCSCCGRELTDPNSIAIGIGPICAEKYGF